MNRFQRTPKAQTFVFFLVSFSSVFLLCGMALDMGLWFLDRSRLSRACDSAAITGAANFGKTMTGDVAVGRLIVANKMRSVAIANFYNLKDISSTPVLTTSVNSAGGTDYTYTYKTADGETGYKVTLTTGLENQVTLARSEAWVKTRTVFMGFTGIDKLEKMSTKASAEAKRRPRLIILILDRSGSMVYNGGSTKLPPAVTNFLSLIKSDAQNNQVGIVSFSSFGRVEMFPTTNFWTPGTNQMYNTASTTANLNGLKFGGNTGADEGMRLALELMRTNKGYTDPQTYKFIVFFTDGEFNIFRTMLTAPTWTNTMVLKAGSTPLSSKNNPMALPAISNGFGPGMTNAMGTPTDVGKGRDYTQTIAKLPGDSKFPTNQPVTIYQGCAAYKLDSTGKCVSTNWSTKGSVPITTNIPLGVGESLKLVAPGYFMDAMFSPGPVSGTAPLTYMTKNGHNYFKASDGGEGYGYVYPDGIYYWYTNNLQGNWTNLVDAPVGPAAELFYGTFNGTTRILTSMSDWQVGLPDFATNYVNAMTNWVSPSGCDRYYVASYTGFARPDNWVETGGTVGPSNFTCGGIFYTNAAGTKKITNINTMSLNGAPTHYFDFRVGKWSNFSSWSSDATSLATPMCQWKVMTYCSMARKADITIFSVGFDGANANILRCLANDRNATNYTPGLPTGKYYYCATANDIITSFTQIAQQILAFLSE